jgi:hypothetical protein
MKKQNVFISFLLLFCKWKELNVPSNSITNITNLKQNYKYKILFNKVYFKIINK